MSRKLCLFLLLILFLFFPVEPTIFGENEGTDFVAAYENHFASPIIQLRSLLVTWTLWVANLAAWILLGNIWAFIRGDDYNSDLNIITVWNFMLSDTFAFQQTVKAGAYGAIGSAIWWLLASLGPPLPVTPSSRRRREADDDEIVWIKDKLYQPDSPLISNDTDGITSIPSSFTLFNWTSDREISLIHKDQEGSGGNRKTVSQTHAASNQEVHVSTNSGDLGKSSDSSATSVRIKRQAGTRSFYNDVFIPAMNQNLEPQGIGRNTLIVTVIALAQTIFWLACAILLPQGLFS